MKDTFLTSSVGVTCRKIKQKSLSNKEIDVLIRSKPEIATDLATVIIFLHVLLLKRQLLKTTKDTRK